MRESIARDDEFSRDTSVPQLDRSAAIVMEVRRLSVLVPWRSVAAIAWQWAWIGTAAGLAVWADHWAAYGAAMVVIATRQHALATLMHEGAHWRLHPDRGLNDLLSDLFCAYPIGISTALYRSFHFDHHRYTKTDRDPEVQDMKLDADWQWPKSKRELAIVLAKDVLGINFPKTMRIINLWSPYPRLFKPAANGFRGREKATFALFALALLSFLFATRAWLPFLLLWQLPLMTLFGAIFRVRALGEHACLAHDHELTSTRTTQATPWERFLVAPCNIHYHLEHHLFPSVPFYNLPALHEFLEGRPEYRDRAHVTHAGYFDTSDGVFAEVTRSGG